MNQEEIKGCSSCEFEDRRFLLNVRYRGSLRRLCVSCVLKFHTGLFCPNCFDVYDSGSPPSDSIKCIQCHSISHSQCASPDLVNQYVCPSCADPSFLFFGTASNAGNKGRRVIDLMAAKALLAAARISSASMNRAVAAARLDVERKVKEAALARKRAREVLERLYSTRMNSVVSKEKIGEKSRTLSSVMAVEKSKKSKGSSAVAPIQNNVSRLEGKEKLVMAVEKSKKSKGSNAVAPIQNNGSRLEGKEKLGGYRAPILVQRTTTKNFSPAEGAHNLYGSSIQNYNVRLEENEMKLRDISPVKNHIMGEMKI